MISSDENFFFFFLKKNTSITASDDVTLMIRDETHFHSDGSVNKLDFRYLMVENPKEKFSLN